MTTEDAGDTKEGSIPQSSRVSEATEGPGLVGARGVLATALHEPSAQGAPARVRAGRLQNGSPLCPLWFRLLLDYGGVIREPRSAPTAQRSASTTARSGAPPVALSAITIVRTMPPAKAVLGRFTVTALARLPGAVPVGTARTWYVPGDAVT